MATPAKPNVERLEENVLAYKDFSTSIYVEIDGVIYQAEVRQDLTQSPPFRCLLGSWAEYNQTIAREFEPCHTIVSAFSQMGTSLSGMLAFPETVNGKVAAIPQGGDLLRLTHAAWSEVLKCSSSGAAPDMDSARQRRDEMMRSKLWPELVGAQKGIEAWNAHANAALEVSWQGSDLAGRQLQGAILIALDLTNSTFDGANLDGARFGTAQINGATFRGASMMAAILQSARATGADFSQAVMHRADLSNSTLCNAIFVDTDLTQANLNCADLRGVDLTSTLTLEAQFEGAKYDEKTTLPANFPQLSKLFWSGSGPSPYMIAMKKDLSEKAVGNFDEFIRLLHKIFGRTRMENARKMLIKDRCLIVAEVSEKGLTGVVRSHLEPNVSYGCHLGPQGQYSCITQKLTPCRNLKDSQWHTKRAKEKGELGLGLQVAPCKHLMVLFITVAQTNKMDLPVLVKWIVETFDRKPVLAKALITKILLKYQSAQTSDLDWRPLESVPEDYYSV